MAQAGKPGGGVSGKPGGGLGGMMGGQGSPMTPAQAAAANGTRNQNLYTTVGGLSRPSAPGGKATRPSGPSGPPAAKTAAPSAGATPKPTTLPSNILDPLINLQAPYPTNTGGAGAAYPPPNLDGQEAGMAEMQNPMLEFNPITGKMEQRRKPTVLGGTDGYGKSY